MDDKLDQILAKLDSIEQRLSRIETSVQKMDDHVDFVNDSYVSLRGPLDYVRDRFHRLTGGESRELPQIKNMDQ